MRISNIRRVEFDALPAESILIAYAHGSEVMTETMVDLRSHYEENCVRKIENPRHSDVLYWLCGDEMTNTDNTEIVIFRDGGFESLSFICFDDEEGGKES